MVFKPSYSTSNHALVVLDFAYDHGFGYHPFDFAQAMFKSSYLASNHGLGAFNSTYDHGCGHHLLDYVLVIPNLNYIYIFWFCYS
jgi:hypothetical protein